MSSKRSLVFISSWLRLSIQERTFLVVSILTLASISIIFTAAIKIILLEQRENLTALAASRALSMSVAVEAELQRQVNHEQTIIIDSAIKARMYALERWPEKNEFFVGRSEGRKFLFGRNASRQIWMSDFGQLQVPWRKLDQPQYWFTSDEFFLGSNTLKVSEEGFEKRPLVQFYKSSNTGYGTRSLTSERGIFFASFHEVPGTNIVVAVELAASPRANLSKKLYPLVGITSVVALVFIYIFSRLNSATVSQLGTHVAEAVQNLRTGNFRNNIARIPPPESAQLFNALIQMEQMYISREKKFKSFIDAVKKLFSDLQNLTGPQDSFDVCSELALLIMKNFSFESSGSAWVYITLSDQQSQQESNSGSNSNNFLKGHLVAQGQKQPKAWCISECHHLRDPKEILKISKVSYVASAGFVFLPLRSGDENVGFFVFEGFKADSFNDLEIFLMDIISKMSCHLACRYLDGAVESAGSVARSGSPTDTSVIASVSTEQSAC